MYRTVCSTASGDTAGIRIIGSAHRNRERTVAGDGDLGAGGGGRDLGGGESTGDNEGGYGSTNKKLHVKYLRKFD
jgi:hypothetical protein